MDFFAAATPDEGFAQAIATRFDSAPLLTFRLSPPPAQSPSMSTSPTTTATAAFPHIVPAQLNAVWLDDPAVLIVDIRPHAAFSSARIPRAVSLSVPSTLLKRPLFSLQRLAAMLPSASARNRFSSWPSASRILVYDADSTTIGDSSNINGLLRKFKLDGFQGELVWLKGGFQAVWRDSRHIVDALPPTPDTEADDDDDAHEKGPTLRTRRLPTAAFSLSSTTVHNSPHFNSAVAPPPKRSVSLLHYHPATPAASTNSHPAFNPFFDTIRQNTELSHGITERIPLRLPRRVRRRIHDLPFPWLQDIARRAANAPRLHNASSSSSESEDDPDGANPVDIEEGKETLAMQFFKIELSEQRRLMGIMAHHSKESGQEQNTIPFPFSITAGVEKGAKNRYRHIWPFEHARVRLHQKEESDDDYVNASYIQPLGTNRRYIATQGPLPATFTDFWTLCWEQNIHVIVMLTREVEGAMVKCGTYWTDSVFGPLRLRLISTEGLPPPDDRPSTAGFFAQHTSLAVHSSRPPTRHIPHSAGAQRRNRHHHYHNRRHETVKRVFELTHTAYPDAQPRRIVHLQYLEWPDMNVPEDPRGVLGLIRQVDEAVIESQANQPSNERGQYKDRVPINDIDEKTGIATNMLENSPVLLHCSAGVGRTGGFIAVHAILDAIRKEIRKKRDGKAMDLDMKRPTIPFTVSSDAEEKDPALVVHVPLATPMQVDIQPDSAGSNPEMISEFPLDTKLWAENVRQETGIDGPRQSTERQEPQDFPMQDEMTLSESASSAPTPNSVAGSSQTPQSHGSYRYNSSSSLGTSPSGTSSSSEVNFPSSNPPHRDVGLTSDLLHSVPHKQQSAVDQHRLRTVSAPTANMSAMSRSPAPFEPSPIRNTTLHRTMQSGNMHEGLAASKLRAFQFRSPSKHGGCLSSDGEPPSRSQSPSADEAAYKIRPPLQVPQHRPVSPRSSTADLSPDQEQTKSFDYKEPRPLHEDLTPPLLTSFGEPVWEVVQDMREQRMSLCQSLRQYVFVHAAIIEGALMIVDEEKDGLPRQPSPPERIPAPRIPLDFAASPGSSRDAHDAEDKSSSSRSPSTSSRPHGRATALSASSIGKRAPSPTELRKEDKEGAVMLAKRPSMKRKQRSGDDATLGRSTKDAARYHPVPVPALMSLSVHAGGVSAPSARAMPP